MNLEEYEKASRLYEKLVFLKPIKNEVYYNLGISYARQNKLALAHYYFGIHFMKLGKILEAGFHFMKASELSKDDPDLKQKIHKMMRSLPKPKPKTRPGNPSDRLP